MAFTLQASLYGTTYLNLTGQAQYAMPAPGPRAGGVGRASAIISEAAAPRPYNYLGTTSNFFSWWGTGV